MSWRYGFPFWVALLLAGGAAAAPSNAGNRVAQGPYCAREYADDFASLNARARELEQQQSSYTFCIRTTATYECPTYGADGALRLKRRKAVAHGTAFAYRQQGRETLLLSAQHVADWPSVTDEDHRVEDVPLGCRRVADSIKIVEKESDDYEPDDVTLSRVVSDVQMDIEILRARVPLPVLPWKVGRSAGLRDRNVVDVRGFPLGAFKATNVGKVISAHDHDDYKDWNHDDFVIDALLSPGNSGSPVLAISCKTGQLELVGVYHARYSGGSALNVVIAIDQIRDLMVTLKRKPHVHEEAAPALNRSSRTTLVESLKLLSTESFFPFGSLPVALRLRRDGALLYEILSREFPFRPHPILVIEDLVTNDPTSFGSLGRVWFGNRQGLRPYERADLDAETQAQMEHVIEALRRDAVTAFALQAAVRKTVRSRESFEQLGKIERAARKTALGFTELSQLAADLAERLAPQGADKALPLSEVFNLPTPKPTEAPPPKAQAAERKPRN